MTLKEFVPIDKELGLVKVHAASTPTMAARIRDIEREHANPVRSRQNTFVRRSHGDDYVPSLRVEWRAVATTV